MFTDRTDAALRLAGALQDYRGKNPLILAIPRGAVPMAPLIAKQLGGDFDVVLARKLRAPRMPETAIGAVDETGWTYLSPYAEVVGATEQYLAQERQIQMETMHKRRLQYDAVRHCADPAGRIVIVIDDGLATGATMIAALHGLRGRKPAKLICAVPVASPESLSEIREIADQVVCLDVPDNFYAVGQVYADFSPVEDAEVISILKAAKP